MLHPPPDRVVEAPQWKLDHALLGGRSAFDHGPIKFVDGARFEQLAELRQRLAVAAKDQAARGVFVEPVRQRRRARQAETQRVEVVLDAFVLVARVRRPGGYRPAPRLVDYEHQPVAVEEPRHHLFGGHVCLLGRNGYHGQAMNDSSEGSWWRRLNGGLKSTSAARGGALSDP